MPKFYVSSGDLEEVVDAPDRTAAIVLAMQKSLVNNKSDEFYYGVLIVVSEYGFGGCQPDDFYIDTKSFLDSIKKD